MIVYNDILQKLSEKGWSSYKLRKAGLIGEATLQRIRNGLSISTDTIDKICKLLECQPADIMSWERDD